MNQPFDLNELARVATDLDAESQRASDENRAALDRMMARLDNGETVVVWMYGELKKRGMNHDDILLELAKRI